MCIRGGTITVQQEKNMIWQWREFYNTQCVISGQPLDGNDIPLENLDIRLNHVKSKQRHAYSRPLSVQSSSA